MNGILQDFRHAGRALARSPGFALVAVLTLGLGIGSVTTIYGTMHGILLRPLPFEEPERLVALLDARPEQGEDGTELSYPNFVDYREHSAALESAGAVAQRSVSLSVGGEAEYVQRAEVSAELFGVLRVSPALGRGFLPEEDRPGAPPVAVLAHSLWQSAFGGDPAVLGGQVRLNGRDHTVVGIMPSGFRFPDQASVWTPLALDAEQRRGGHYLLGVGRLRPGATVEQADAELKAIGARLAEAYPETNTGWTGAARPLREELVGDARPVLALMLGAVGFVLLIACANVANLLLARATSRQREVAVRLALGAGRGRLVRQLLSESVLLGLAGGAVGVIGASWGLSLLQSALPADAPYWMVLEIDGAVLLFTLVLSVTTGLIFGLAPALQVSGSRARSALADGARGSVGRGVGRLRAALVVGEVALSLVLLVGATLMVRSAIHVQSVDPGFRRDGALTARLTLAGPRYQEPGARTALQQRLIEEVGALPGVQSTAATNLLPLSGATTSWAYHVVGATNQPGQEPSAEYRPVGGDLFGTLGLPLLRGRTFSPAEVADTAAQLVVINHTMAQRWWPGEDPIGQRIGFHGESGPLRTVVGVVGDARHAGLGEPVRDQVYVPFASSPSEDLSIVLRTAGEPAALSDELRATLRGIDPDLAVYDVRSLEGLVRESTMENRLFGWLFGLFAGLALLLASVGLYAVLSYIVGQRTREIGIRVALGARAADVVRHVIGRGLGLTGAGIVLGLLGAYAVTRLLSSLLYGVSATDPVTFAGVALTLAAVAAIASYVPARRAARIDPMAALRNE